MALIFRIFPIVTVAFVLFFATHAMAAEHTFRYDDPSVEKVEVVGEFNNWKAVAMQRDDDGSWTVTLDIPDGIYGYKFLINGEEWVFDSSVSGRKTVNGIENSEVTVGTGVAAEESEPTQQPDSTPVPVTEPESLSASQPGWQDHTFYYSESSPVSVHVAGSFNDWSVEATPMSRNDDGVWVATVSLPQGETTYKFFVDGEWKNDPSNPHVAEDGQGGSNSVVTIGDAPTSP